MRSARIRGRSLVVRSLAVVAVVLSPALMHAQPAKGSAPIKLQLPECNVQVSGFNTGTDDVKVMTVRLIEASSSTVLAGVGTFTIPTGGRKVQKPYSRLAKCDVGSVEVTLERQSSPAKTFVVKQDLTPTRTSVELGDVKLLF